MLTVVGNLGVALEAIPLRDRAVKSGIALSNVPRTSTAGKTATHRFWFCALARIRLVRKVLLEGCSVEDAWSAGLSYNGTCAFMYAPS